MNALTQAEQEHRYLTKALVLDAGEGDCFRLASDAGETVAKRAFSCLIRPEAGDLVLVAGTGSDCHLLAVLDRPTSAPAVITLPAEAIVSGRKTELKSEILKIQSSDTEVKSGRLKMGGGLLGLDFAILSVSAKQMIVVVRNLVQRCRRLRLEAGQNASIAAGRLRISGKDGVVVGGREVDLKAEGAVKVDGRKIMLG